MAGLQTFRIAGLLLLAMLVAAGNRATRYLRAADEQNPSDKPKTSLKPKATESAATAALKWLARHQMPQGNWSLQKYTDKCTDQWNRPLNIANPMVKTSLCIICFGSLRQGAHI
jgi:hypothetical protein